MCTNEDALKNMEMNPSFSKSIQGYVPSNEEFFDLNSLCNLLQPLKELTSILSASKYCTISLLYPFIYTLIHDNNIFSINPSDKKFHILKQNLITSIKCRFNNLFTNNLFLAATFLDYKFKKLEFLKMINF